MNRLSEEERRRPDRNSGCAGKVAFPNGTLAWRALRLGLKRDGNRRADRCRHCGKWHHSHAKDL